MGKLETSLKIGANVNGALSGIKKLRSSLKGLNNLRLGKLSASLRKVGKSAQNLGKRLSSAIGTVAVGGFFAKLVKDASDAQETINKFNVVFSSNLDQANKAARDLAAGYGLSSNAAKELIGNTGDLLTGFGFSSEAALDVSEKVQKLAVDLASFTNFSGGSEGASAALTKALLGETESLKSLGIAINQDLVKKRVQQLEAKGVVFETNKQAKAYATLALATEQSKNAVGDFARSSKSFANQLKVAKANLSNLSVELGQILLPFATKAIVLFSRLALTFQQASPQAKKLFLAIVAGVALLGPAIVVIGVLISSIGSIGGAVAALSGVFKTLAVVGFKSLAFLVSPVGLVTAAILGVVAGIVVAIARFSALKSAGVGAFDAIKIMMLDVADFLNTVFFVSISAAINLLLSGINTIRAAFGQELAPEVNMLGFNETIDQARANILEKLNVSEGEIPDSFDVIAAKVKETFNAVADSISESISGVIPSLAKTGDSIDDLTKKTDDLSKASGKAKTKALEIKVPTPEEMGVTAANTAATGLTTAMGQVADGTKKADKAFKDFAGNFLKQIGDMIVQAVILKAIKSAVGGVESASGGFISGGQVTQRFADGGAVIGAGSGTSDSVPAMLSNGEFVTDAKTTSFFGKDFFVKLKAFSRAGIAQPSFAGAGRFADGGFVGAGGGDFLGNSGSGSTAETRISIVNNGSDSKVSSVSETKDAKGTVIQIVLDDLKSNGPTSKALQSSFGLKRKGFR